MSYFLPSMQFIIEVVYIIEAAKKATKNIAKKSWGKEIIC